MSRPSLELYCEVETADGARHRWDANQPASHRLRNLSFSTKTGEGFSTLTGTLARRIDLDYPDLQLGMRIVVTAADGGTVFEGRLSAMPRELGDTHSISVTFTGYMAHAKDRKFSEIYADRDIGSWGPISASRRAALLTGGYGMVESGSQATDPATSTAGVLTSFQGAWGAGFQPLSEAWYEAPAGTEIGQVTFSWQILGGGAGIAHANVNWVWKTFLSTDAMGTSLQDPGNLRAAGPVVNTVLVADGLNTYRYAVFQLRYGASPDGGDGVGYELLWTKPAVYGAHGLTLHEGEPGEPHGVYASDALRDIAGRFCPDLNTDGVQDSTYVIQHLKFDRTFPYDAFLELNKFHLWHLAVWENRTLTFRPYDLTDYDWEIRTDDPGTTFSPVGPTVDGLFNGIEVVYTDILTGSKHVLSPDDHDELLDTSDENPWNEWGLPHWDEIELSAPTLEAQALQIGRAALAERNRPKTAGTLTVRGYIRDRAGIPQPVSKVRAGDVICLTNFNEVNRLIIETDYDDETKSLRVAVDFPFQTLEAFFDREANARQARGL